jgi:hypothetical protein
LVCVLLHGCFLISSGIGSPEMLSSAIYSIYIGLGFRYKAINFYIYRSVLSAYAELKKTCGLYDGLINILGDLKNCS